MAFQINHKEETFDSHFPRIHRDNFPQQQNLDVSEQDVNVKFKAKSQKIKKNKTPIKGIRATVSELLKVERPKNKSSTSKKTKGEARCGEAAATKPVNSLASADFSGLPPPFCSCTGVSRRCYKCGGGWQSSCCTTSLSEYPLPLNPSRPGNRLPGRKMSNGAYNKLLFTLATEGGDLSNPVDLKKHWAKHGSNKFITLK
ncbi:unnamed protein product [Withania somnifera]